MGYFQYLSKIYTLAFSFVPAPKEKRWPIALAASTNIGIKL